MTKTEWMGLWKTRDAVYISKPMTQKQIKELPKKTRIVLRYNKYHKGEGSNTPKFVFCFADAEGSESICFEMKNYKDKMEKLIEGIREVGEVCKGRYCYNDDDFLFDTYEKCCRIIDEVMD